MSVKFNFCPETGSNVEFTPEDAVVKTFIASGLSYREFAKKHRIPKSTLWDMVNRHFEENSEQAQPKKSSKGTSVEDIYVALDEFTETLNHELEKLYQTLDNLDCC